MIAKTIELGERRTANGGYEYFLLVGDTPQYAGASRVGVFSETKLPEDESLRRLLRQWTKEAERGR